MDFNILDKEMRKYEQSLDQCILPEIYIVARLDGRSFTRLTKEKCAFEAPFDERFRDLMIETTRSLMDCGFNVVYGYTESDEISLLFHRDDMTFGRKTRKINSTLAGEASASFSVNAGVIGTFDCRVVPLPTVERVKDYFMWRQEDAHRNSLNSWCYWTLRKEGMTRKAATEMLRGKSVGFKNEMLFERGINYNDLPNWQKRGTGVYFKDVKMNGYNPITGETVETSRRKLVTDMQLNIGEEYGEWVASLL